MAKRKRKLHKYDAHTTTAHIYAYNAAGAKRQAKSKVKVRRS